MKDTSAKLESHFIEMMMEKSGRERLKMGFSMFEFARKQVLSAILREAPTATKREIKAQLFHRFYGQEFSPEEQELILAKLR